MQRDPHLTEAMTRAFMFADASAATEVDTVGKLMDRMFTRAMHEGDPTDEDRAIAPVITDVWLSNLIAWVTRRASATDIAERLELTVRRLLGRGVSLRHALRDAARGLFSSSVIRRLNESQSGFY